MIVFMSFVAGFSPFYVAFATTCIEPRRIVTARLIKLILNPPSGLIINQYPFKEVRLLGYS